MINIPIIFEDDDLVVINKPSGITVNKSDTAKNELTIQDWVEKNIKLSFEKNGVDDILFSEFANRGGIVHRLDKETSGALVVAKNPKSFELMKKQFMDRSVKKTYLALVHGQITTKTGEINAPIGRETFNRMRFGVTLGGREALTKYEVINSNLFLGEEKLSLVELYPQTGRTHQIRVHLKHIGYPIFGDELYAGRKNSQNDRKFLNRFFLHAKKIEFNHPISNKLMKIEVPLAEDLNNFLKVLTN